MRRIGKILMSRLAVFGIVVFIELLLVMTLLVRLSAFSVYFLFFLLTLNFLSVVAVVNSDGNPEYKLTWIGVIIFIPYLGTALYFLYGSGSLSRREEKIIKEVRGKIKSARRKTNAFDKLGEKSAAASGKALAIVGADTTAAVYINTSAKYYSSGKEMYSDMRCDLLKAQKYVFLEYFIIERGTMWQGIFEILKQKVNEGVEVRIIYDDVGCMTTLPLGFYKELSSAGIKAVRFSKISPSLRYMRRNNSRDHRKILVIDGKVAYTGGINIGDEYIGLNNRLGVWRDSGVRISGRAAEGFASLFLEMWCISTGRVECIQNYFGGEDSTVRDNGYYLPFGSGPNPFYKSNASKRAILDIVNSSQRYVYIFTPYLIIDFDLTESLLGAVLRGADVRIITPGVPDKPLIRLLTRGSYQCLLSGGVKIYEYSPGFLHAKGMVSDDTYAIVGTINLDYRSLVHHYENAVWTCFSNIAKDVRDDFLSVMRDSVRITSESIKTGPVLKILRSVIRLFAPLL